jgi:hypothetical protein
MGVKQEKAKDLGKISPCGRNDSAFNLGVSAPWREKDPNPEN